MNDYQKIIFIGLALSLPLIFLQQWTALVMWVTVLAFMLLGVYRKDKDSE